MTAAPNEQAHLTDAELLDKLFVLLCTTGKWLPEDVRNGPWEALRTHLLERLNSGPAYTLSKAQLKHIKDAR